VSGHLIVYKNRTNKITVSLGIDVSADTITSEIRVGKDVSTDLIATWNVAFLTDGTDGELVLTLDDSDTENIAHRGGYMDIKRLSGGEPLVTHLDPIPVVIQGVVTA